LINNFQLPPAKAGGKKNQFSIASRKRMNFQLPPALAGG
jgi:hypothetical protein